MRDDINIRAPRFLLARTVGCCGRCRATTPLFAIAVPPGHMALELDEMALDEGTAVDVWRIAQRSALLFHVEYLPEPVQQRLRAFCLALRPAGSPGEEQWTNHCEHCGSPQNDHELFCEPEGAFLPIGEYCGTAIQLISIDETFEAAAGGYVPELPF